MVLRGELLRRNPAVRAKHCLRHIKPLTASAYKGGAGTFDRCLRISAIVGGRHQLAVRRENYRAN